MLDGFSPSVGGTLAVSNSSSNVQLGLGPVVILYNVGTVEAFYAVGPASSTAATAQSSSTAAPTSNSYSLPGNTYVVLNLAENGYLAAITATGTTTIRIVQGYGYA